MVAEAEERLNHGAKCIVAKLWCGHGYGQPWPTRWLLGSLVPFASCRLAHGVAYLQLQDVNERSFWTSDDFRCREIQNVQNWVWVEQKEISTSAALRNGWPTGLQGSIKGCFFIFSMFFQCVSLLRTGCNTNDYNAYISLLTIKYEPVCCAERPWLLPWSWFTWLWDLPWDLYVFGAGGWTCCILPALSPQRVSPVSPNLELMLKQPDSQTQHQTPVFGPFQYKTLKCGKFTQHGRSPNLSRRLASKTWYLCRFM